MGNWAKINLKGLRFNSLTVIEFIKTENKRFDYWKCFCDCGKEVIVSSQYLKSEEIKSCGCLNDKPLYNRDRIGETFDNLTILEYKKENGKQKFICICDCGDISDYNCDDITKGKIKSCGCKLRKTKREMTKINHSGEIINNIKILKNILGRKGNFSYYKCKCFCGKIFIANYNQLTLGFKKSCGCAKKSLGERKIEILLLDNNIKFEREKSFNNCKNISLLRFDFFVDNKYIIEFDGLQHFIKDEVGFFKSSLEEIHFKDIIKNEFCNKNKIPIIRIPYDYINKIKIEDLKIESSKFILSTKEDFKNYYKKYGIK